MKVGKIKSLLCAVFGCFYAFVAHSATSLFSSYGQIQNVQNYSTNPFWSPNSAYNQKMPQPVYAQGTDVSTEECLSVMQSAVSMQCMARDNCRNTSLSDIRPAIVVQLSNLPGKAYSTACIGYLDTVYESYVARYGNNAPTKQATLPVATTPNPTAFGGNQNAIQLNNPYPATTPKWEQEEKAKARELEYLQRQNGSGNYALSSNATLPTTFSDESFSKRNQILGAGYEPYKGVSAYKTINVESDDEYCPKHPDSVECTNWRQQQQEKAANTGTNNNSNTNQNTNTQLPDKAQFSGSNTFIKDCFARFEKNDEKWQNAMVNILKNDSKLSEDSIKLHQSEIYNLLANNVKDFCLDMIAAIARSGGSAQIHFKYNNQDVSFNANVVEIFNHFPLQVAILVLKDKSKKLNDIIYRSELPKDYWWSKDCSDHTIYVYTSDNAAINKAGQSTFTEFGGAEHEYYIDFPDGKSTRAFPGLIIQEKNQFPQSKEDRIVVYNNVLTGLKKLDDFAKALKGKQCSQDGLAAYLVAINAQKTSDSNDITHLASGVGGAAAAGIATVALASNPAGWVVAGIMAAGAAAGAAVTNFIPTNIANIQQVAVIDGPKMIE